MKPTKRDVAKANKIAEKFMPGFEVVEELPEADAAPVQAQVQAKRMKFRVVTPESDNANVAQEVVQVVQMKPKGAADAQKGIRKSVIVKGGKVVGTQG